MHSQQLPQSSALEEQVLNAALMHDPERTALVVDALRREDFYSQHRGMVFDAISRVGHENDFYVDALMVRERLVRFPAAQAELAALGEVTHNAVVPLGHIEAACRKVRALSDARRLIQAALEVVAKAVSPDIVVDPNDFLDDVSASFTKAMQSRAASAQTQSFAEVVGEIIQEVRQPISQIVDDSIPFPIAELNRLLGNAEPGELIALAALPGQGKSAYAWQCVMHAALERGVHGVFYPYEMRSIELGKRALAGMAGVNGRLLRKSMLSKLSRDDARRIEAAAMRTLDIPISIVDSIGMPIEALCRHARREKALKRCGLIVVDYLQLVPSETKHASREELITATSRRLKQLALELKVVVIALSQLKDISSKDGEPDLGDFRFSRAIGEDADKVLFIYEAKGQPNLSTFKVDKNRTGETGIVTARFERQFTRFVDLEDQVL